MSRYQIGKTNLDLTEARDSEWQWHQLGHMQVCTELQTDNHASTPPLSFLQAGCSSCRPTNSVKALKARSLTYRQSVFKRYHSDKHFLEFYLQDGGKTNWHTDYIWNKITSLSPNVTPYCHVVMYKYVVIHNTGSTYVSIIFVKTLLFPDAYFIFL